MLVLLFWEVGSAATHHPFNSQKQNVLLICIDDLRPELNCYGASYIHSPNIDQLAAQGRLFQRHYVQAPTCGASRYTLLTGVYGGTNNGALFQRANRLKSSPSSINPSLPAWFRNHGYQTVSVGKVSHHPGGRGGKNWDDPNQLEMPNSWDRHLLPAGRWQHPRGWMHGLANGEIRINANKMDVFQALEGPDTSYPDGISVNEALAQMDRLGSEKPFFLAVGILRPHLPFGAPLKYAQLYDEVKLPPIPHPKKPIAKSTWHGSGEFMKYNRWKKNPNTDAAFADQVRKHYAACVSYADVQVGRLVQKLTQNGLSENTIVVLWGDHGWHLGEHAVWGKHTLFEESLRSPLILHYPGMPHAGQSTNAIVESLDLFPTLCDLTGIPMPTYVDGVSLTKWIEKPDQPGHSAISYNGNHKTIRTNTHRLILHKNGFVELYDHQSVLKETQNIAQQNKDLVDRLTKELNQKLGTK